MFGDNWFLFLLIILLVFSADGNISSTETSVLLAILFALTISCPNCEGSDSDPRNCFCNKSGV